MASGGFFPQEIIRKKRDGGALSTAEIDFMVAGLTAGSVTEGQAAALAMAIFFQGMSAGECGDLTRAMTHSGEVLDWSDLGRAALDKHSTGGVGDKVSLIVGPLVAACGGAVPMISGRGLGHTGGTLDKLDSIPGYTTTPGLERFRAVVREAGCAIIGQTEELAPADRRLYAIRDVTATVESIPLITASILSKKLAAGLDGLVMDVKFGSGAFMREKTAAKALAENIVATAAEAGLPTVALLTDMNQVLGRTAGNALEVAEAVDHLTGRKRDPRLGEVTLALTAELLVLGGLAADVEAARARCDRALSSGAGAEAFQQMVRGLGGPADLIERPEAHLPAAPVVLSVPPAAPGIVSAVDVRALGLAVMDLGGGRRRAQDPIDHAVGLSDVAAVGEAVDGERPLARVHARDDAAARRAAATLQAAIAIGTGETVPAPVIDERVASPASWSSGLSGRTASRTLPGR